MSIQTPPKRLVFSKLDAASVNVNAGVISIKGLPSFTAAEVSAASCGRACKTACVPQAVTLTPTVPSTTCECPWLWELKVVKLPCTKTYRSWEIFTHTENYNYTDESGAALTVNGIVTSIVAQINANPDSVVTAAAVGTAGSYTAFTLTEKDCDGQLATCGFDAFITSGAASAPTAHVGAILSDDEIAREFPIQEMGFMSRPELAYCGSYCKYVFTIDPVDRKADVAMPNGMIEVKLRVEIFVNKDLANFLTDWDTPLATALTCLGAPLT